MNWGPDAPQPAPENCYPASTADLPAALRAEIEAHVDARIQLLLDEHDAFVGGLLAQEAARHQAPALPPDATKEQIYDALIAPHMTAIIGIAAEAGIPIFACFQLTTEAEAAALGTKELYCTTWTQPPGVNQQLWNRFYYGLRPTAINATRQ